jgi:hypothetical protein
MSNKVKEPFKKELIYFDEKSYQKAVQEAEAKINILDDAIAFISDYVGTVNIKECLSQGFVPYLLDKLPEVFPKFSELQLDALKIVQLKDIPIENLKFIESKYHSSIGKVKYSKEGLIPDVDKAMFCKYTKNQSENDKLRLAKRFIRVLDEIGNHSHVYPFDIVKATSGFVNYNMLTKEYTLRTD